MTDQVKPMDREAWEKRIGHLAVLYRNFAFAEVDLGGFGGTEGDCWEKYASEKSRLVTDILALQSQLTEALAEVERLMEVVKFYADDDTYHIDILGACGLSNDMDDWGQFGKKAKEAIEAIEKARQPK